MGVRLSELHLGPVPTDIKSATFAIGNFSNCNRYLSLLSSTKKQNTNYDGYNLAEAKMNLNSLLFSQELNDIRRKWSDKPYWV